MRPPYGPIPLVTIACVSYAVTETSESSRSAWVEVVNAWVRGVADRLAAHGHPALAVPLFSRTAPNLDLANEPADLVQGRRHKDATTSEQILGDVAAAVSWVRARYPQAAVHVVGFCFGGHAAFLAATLPGVEQVFNFYGAGISRVRPGGGEPSLALLPEIQARLTFVFGMVDPLIPHEDREAIGDALRKADPAGQRLRFVECAGADHGFACEARRSQLSPGLGLGMEPSAGGITLWFSPEGWQPWRQWVWVALGWYARPCWRAAPSPLFSPAAFYAV